MSPIVKYTPGTPGSPATPTTSKPSGKGVLRSASSLHYVYLVEDVDAALRFHRTGYKGFSIDNRVVEAVAAAKEVPFAHKWQVLERLSYDTKFHEGLFDSNYEVLASEHTLVTPGTPAVAPVAGKVDITLDPETYHKIAALLNINAVGKDAGLSVNDVWDFIKPSYDHDRAGLIERTSNLQALGY